jgi:hypothetical protein
MGGAANGVGIMITDKQIEALKNEAAVAGDLAQVAICDSALDGDSSAVSSVVESIVDSAMSQNINVYDFATDKRISGSASRDLVRASVCGSDGGGCSAREIDGVWHLVDESQVSTLRSCGADVRAVYITF